MVPKSVDDDTIIAAANFREGGRFPVLSYRHDGGVSYYLSDHVDHTNLIHCRAEADLCSFWCPYEAIGQGLWCHLFILWAACENTELTFQ